MHPSYHCCWLILYPHVIPINHLHYLTTFVDIHIPCHSNTFFENAANICLTDIVWTSWVFSFVYIYVYIYIYIIYKCIMYLCPNDLYCWLLFYLQLLWIKNSQGHWDYWYMEYIGIEKSENPISTLASRSWHLPDCACRPRPRCTAATKPAPQRLKGLCCEVGQSPGFWVARHGKIIRKPGQSMGPPSRNIKICSGNPKHLISLDFDSLRGCPLSPWFNHLASRFSNSWFVLLFLWDLAWASEFCRKKTIPIFHLFGTRDKMGTSFWTAWSIPQSKNLAHNFVTFLEVNNS